MSLFVNMLTEELLVEATQDIDKLDLDSMAAYKLDCVRG